MHRDLKPANLFVVVDGRLKICDFGIARAAEATSTLTATGRIFGTPAYMSPEQCEGRPVDGRTDLYALGCVLYALLTGRPPFRAHQQPNAIMFQHVHTAPPSPRSVRPNIPAALEAIVLQLLAKDPSDRPADAAAVVNLLSAVHADLTGAPRSHVLLYEAERLASSVEDPFEQFSLVVNVAEAWAADNQDRSRALLAEAERLARTQERSSPGSLVRVAEAWAKTDPDRSRALLAEAEHIAHTMLTEARHSDHPARPRTSAISALRRAAKAWAAHDDLGEAERIARTLKPGQRDLTLCSVARVAAKQHPGEAERIVRSVEDPSMRSSALASIAVLAPPDEARARRLLADAEHLARTIQDPNRQQQHWRT